MNLVYSKSISQLSLGSSIFDLFEEVPIDLEDDQESGGPQRQTPLPKKQMFMICLVTLVGNIKSKLIL